MRAADRSEHPPAPPIAAARWLRLALRLAAGWLLTLTVGIGAALAQAAPAEKRIALVIGNARYPALPLANPENDARLITANLRKLGFEVSERLNLDVREFRKALRDFARRLQQDDAVAVLYYAGHGVQIDGRNYLLPVDVNLRDQEEVKDESVDIEDLFLSRLDRARSSARIVILDACRDNPFAGKTRNIRSAGGLAEMGARGTLIAYASAPGAPAEDGPSGRNSVYTRSLAEEMMVPGLEVEQMFKNVRVKVLRATRERQVPWVNTSLSANFSFNPLRATPQVDEAARQAQVQRLEAELAQARRALEAATARPPTPVAPGNPAPPPAPSAPPAAAAVKNAHELNALQLEVQLDRARRELVAARTEPRVAAAAPTPAGSVAAVPGQRRFLSKAEIEQTLVGKSHTFKTITSGQFIQWDIRSGGNLFFNNLSNSNTGGNGSGRWDVRDDGGLCVKWQDIRSGEGGCWYFFKEDGRILRTGAARQEARVQAEIIKIQ